MALTGDVQIADGRIRSDDPPMAITDITGGVRFREQTFEVSELRAAWAADRSPPREAASWGRQA